jgi:hypothetical protein
MDNVITLARFRTSNLKLTIETRRWNDIHRDQRICHKLCGIEMGNEYHYIMKCSVFNESRRLYVPQVYTQRPNTLKFYNLFSCEDTSVINNLCKFIKIINNITIITYVEVFVTLLFPYWLRQQVTPFT